MNLRLAIAAVTTVLVLLFTADIRAGEERVAELSDAYISRDSDAGFWSIGNRNIRFTFEVDRSSLLSLSGLFLGNGTPVTQGRGPDGLVTFDGRTTGLGARGGPLMVDSVTTQTGRNGVELLVHMRPAQGPLVSVSSGRALLCAFETKPAGPTRAHLERLSRNEVYEVREVDYGLVGRFTGAALADEGLSIEPLPSSAAQVFTIDPVSVIERARKH